MGICFTNPSLRTVPMQEKLIQHSHISYGMKLNNIHDDYKFIRILGHGQYGTVREAHKILNSESTAEKTYAIKSILKKRVKLKLLRRELEIMSVLDHPNLVKFYDIYEDEVSVHLVMEYCSGGDVSERIVNEGNFSESEAAEIMEKLLCAVGYLHANNISHRDLKAENFLYSSPDKSSQVKITDFGMSAKFVEGMRMKSLAGTPYYLAPEVLQGSYTEACDVWSLGVFMYFILSGSHPFKGFTLDDIFEKIVNGKLKFEGREWESASSQAKDLISRLLVVNPKKRITIKSALSHCWFTLHKTKKAQPVPFHIFNALKQYKAQNKLWQEALKVIIRTLSNEEIKDLQKWFLVIDKNSSGTITAVELEEAMKLSGYEFAKDELKKIIEEVSYIGEGNINYSDFLIATLDQKKIIDQEVLMQAFKFFDVDNDGRISMDDMINAFRKVGSEYSVRDIVEMMEDSKLEVFQNADFEVFKRIVLGLETQTESSGKHELKEIVRKITIELSN